MDPTTTLITFMLQTSPSTQSVSLVGSWDNFSSRYPMEKDLRRAHGQWRGCWSFKDIICDGTNANVQKRNGGLKMGQEYWYYYEVDDDTEIHDTSLPSTTSCPYLPGQPVNVLDVPEERNFPSHDRSASMNAMIGSAQTLKPEDKFIKTKTLPPAPRLARMQTSPAIMENSHSAHSTTSKEPTPWSARNFFGLRPRTRASSVESTSQRRSSSRESRSPSISSERLSTSRISPSRTSSRDTKYQTSSLPVSRAVSPNSQRHMALSRTGSIEHGPVRNVILPLNSMTQPLTIPCDIMEEDLGISDDEDDSNFAGADLALEPEKGLSPPPSATRKRSLSSLRSAISDMKPLPMLPFELQTITEGADELKGTEPMLIKSGTQSTFGTASSGLISPTETHFSSPPSFYDSTTDDEDINSEDIYSLAWPGYSLPFEESRSEMTLRKENFESDLPQQNLGSSHKEGSGAVAGTTHELINEMGYLGNIILGK